MIDLDTIGAILFVLLAQLVLLLFKNILNVVTLVFVVLLWRRNRPENGTKGKGRDRSAT